METSTPEFCFAWIDHWSTCMTKSEWSGWMQAIFSVIAIFVAIVLPRWDDWRRQKQLRQQAYVFLLMLASSIKELVQACENHDKSTVQERVFGLEETLQNARTIPLNMLNADWAIRTLASMELARQAIDACSFANSPNSVTKTQFSSAKIKFQSILTHVDRHGTAMAKSDPSNWLQVDGV